LSLKWDSPRFWNEIKKPKKVCFFELFRKSPIKWNLASAETKIRRIRERRKEGALVHLRLHKQQRKHSHASSSAHNSSRQQQRSVKAVKLSKDAEEDFVPKRRNLFQA